MEAAQAQAVPRRARRNIESAQIHREAVVFDAHCDTLMRITDEGFDLGRRASEGHVDLPRLAEGGVDVQVFAVFVEERYLPDRALTRAKKMIDAMEAQLRRHRDRMALARTVADARRLVGRGKLAVFLGLEGGYAIHDDPRNLKLLFDRGVRYMTLTWRLNTNWADGSEDRPRHHGLTDLGRRVVREMNRLGMVVDVSHVSDETFWDVLETTSAPVIASHSCCRALCDHPRNLTDRMLRAVARNGGVVGVGFAAGFLDQTFSRVARKRLAEVRPRLRRMRRECKEPARVCRARRMRVYRAAMRGLPRVPIERLIDHIDHAVKVAGVDHVGLGSDFDGYGVGPVGLEDVSRLPRVTALLLARGYSSTNIKKILGGNFLRVFRKVIGK
jgi:membrane dipeptidase